MVSPTPARIRISRQQKVADRYSRALRDSWSKKSARRDKAAGHAVPEVPFVCTVQVARKKWGLKPNDLASVCRRLGIGLIHHNALSDAEACARIVIAAGATG